MQLVIVLDVGTNENYGELSNLRIIQISNYHSFENTHCPYLLVINERTYEYVRRNGRVWYSVRYGTDDTLELLKKTIDNLQAISKDRRITRR